MGGHLGGVFIGIACFQLLGDALWVYALAEVLALWSRRYPVAWFERSPPSPFWGGWND
ncbi:MAG: hypothetical protein ACSLE5_15035 [Porticoccaceae bacterium]